MAGGIVNPLGRSVVQQHTLAPRTGTLEGATVGLVDSCKRNSDILLAEIGDLLMGGYGVKQVVTRRKPHFSLPFPPEMVEELAGQVDAVVAAVGD